MRLAPRIGNWRADLLRLVATGVGSLLALTLANWPSNAAEAAWVALGGAVVGLVLAFAVEYIVRLHLEVRRLHGIETTLDAERRQHAQHVRLLEHQVKVARAESEINATFVKVWGEAYTESTKTGQLVPLEALMARMQVMQKAKGLDKPIPPPKLD